LALSGGVNTETGFPLALAFSGEIAVGLACYNATSFIGNGFCVKATGAVGVDILNPMNNYFQLSVASLSLDVLLRATVGSKTSVPSYPSLLNHILQLPNGFTISFATAAIKSPAIPAGFAFQTKILVFGYGVDMKFSFSESPLALTASFKLDNINFCKAFSLRNVGFFVNIGGNDFGFGASATVSILGITGSTNLQVSQTGFNFEVSGNLLGGGITTDLKVSAIEDKFKAKTFQVFGNVHFGSIGQIWDGIKQKFKQWLHIYYKQRFKHVKNSKIGVSMQINKCQFDIEIHEGNADALKNSKEISVDFDITIAVDYFFSTKKWYPKFTANINFTNMASIIDSLWDELKSHL